MYASGLVYSVVNLTTLSTAMDTDKIKVFGARLKVDGTGKLAELERAERVSLIPGLSHHFLTPWAGKNEDKS